MPGDGCTPDVGPGRTSSARTGVSPVDIDVRPYARRAAYAIECTAASTPSKFRPNEPGAPGPPADGITDYTAWHSPVRPVSGSAELSVRFASPAFTRWHNQRVAEDVTQYWFKDGVEAYRLRLEADGRNEEISEITQNFSNGEAYACPCCLNLFGREALQGPDSILTKEDVPPKAVGGRPVLLTCKGCNNPAGALWDFDAAQHKKVLDSLAGAGQRPLAMELRVGDNLLRGNFSYVNGMPFFEYVESRNDPATVANLGTEVEALIEADTPFDFQLAPGFAVDVHDAAWSWIRAAYLAVFAVAGYRYALLPEIRQMREAIATPSSGNPAPNLVLQVPNGFPAPPSMFRVLSPPQLQSLMISFGHLHVFLPDWENVRTIEDVEVGVIWARSQIGGPPPKVDVKPIPWPTKALYSLDKRPA